MSDLRELYQQTILDHNRAPRNFGEVPDANRHARGDNPLCGDKIDLHVKIDDDRIVDVGFTGSGCAISQASASLMTAAVKGRTVDEVNRLFTSFHAMVTGGEADPSSLGKLAVFGGVREFPARVKCANLPWHTLHAALQGADAPVSTE